MVSMDRAYRENMYVAGLLTNLNIYPWIFVDLQSSQEPRFKYLAILIFTELQLIITKVVIQLTLAALQ
jgi:hypothetical protein